MPKFEFKDYGTFTGPSVGTGATDETGYYKYDDPVVSGEVEKWWEDIPEDTSFKSDDCGMNLFTTKEDYLGMHMDSNSTSKITVEHAMGNIPMYAQYADQTSLDSNVRVVGDINIAGNVDLVGEQTLSGLGNVADYCTETRSIANSKKSFDIKHPNKEGHRLRHVCVEGPESAVYVRGKLKDNTIIELPDYWVGLVDPETISVHLTPIGVFQDLFVEAVQWGKRVVVKSGSGAAINCYYQVWAERLGEELHVEYEGLTPKDYPGDNKEYNVNGL